MRHVRSSFVACLLAAALSSPGSVVFAAQATSPAAISQQYTMVDLSPAGSTTSTAADNSPTQQIGSAGFLTATATGSSVQNHAMIWNGNAGSSVDLGPGSALALADGQQGGTANAHAALWTGTPESLIDLNPPTASQSTVTGMTSGQQVGWAIWNVLCSEKRGACGGGGGTTVVLHPLMWSGSAASMIDLTPFALGLGAGRALGTDGTQQVGFAQPVLAANAFGAPNAMLWLGSADTAINLNPTGSIESQANGVAGGQQVGYGFSPHRALLWSGSASSAVDLTPAGYTTAEANATNGSQQVGFGISDNINQVGICHALVWSGDAASALDLNQFMPLGFTSAAATGIDSAGNIVGWASQGSRDNPSNVHAVLWVPSTASTNSITSLQLSQGAIIGADTVQATITLNQPAPAGGASVNIASTIDQPALTPGPLTVLAPSIVTVAEGASTATFAITVSVTSLTGFSRPYQVEIQAGYGDIVRTSLLVINPPTYLASITVAPANIEGGFATTGTVLLNSPAPAGGALVAISSNNAAVVPPASVLIPAGLNSASFPVQTGVVGAFTNVTLTATYGSSIPASASTVIVVTPPPVAVDAVAIQKADYISSKKQLVVQATSTSQSALLAVTTTAGGQLIGYLTNKGAGRYQGTFVLASNPQNITVTSDLTGTASTAVTLK